MARPIKTGLDYFPFDVDLFQDEKVVAIAGEFGLKGEIIIVKLLCAIYRSGYFIRWSDMLKYKLVNELPGVSADLLESVVSRLVKWDFFNKDLFENEGILTSYGIQRRYHAICSKMHRKEIVTVFSLLGEVAPRKREPQPQVDTPAPKPKAGPAPLATPSFTPTQKVKLEDSITQLKEDTMWGEPVCMRYKIPDIAKLHSLIDNFREYCLTYGETEHDDMKHVKRHFCQWLSKVQTKSQTKAVTPPPKSSANYEFNGGFGGKDI